MEAKWVYSFRRERSRELSAEEITVYRRAARHRRLIAVAIAIAAIADFIVSLGFVVVAADRQPGAWIGVIVGCIAFFWIWAKAGDAERTALLFRRVARKERVDVFVARTRPEKPRFDLGDPDEEEWLPNPYWEMDEKFEELLVRICGHRPEWFETPEGDDVLLTVEGERVKKAHDVHANRLIEKPEADA